MPTHADRAHWAAMGYDFDNPPEPGYSPIHSEPGFQLDEDWWVLIFLLLAVLWGVLR